MDKSGKSPAHAALVCPILPSMSLTSPATIAIWENAVKQCETTIKKVTPSHMNGMLLETSSMGLIDYASSLQRRYTAKSSNRVLLKLSPFLTRLKSIAAAVDVMVQVEPKIAGLLWGSLRIVLELAINAVAVLENILEMFDKIMSTIPRFDTYTALFPVDEGGLSQSVTNVFIEVILFCVKAIEYLRRKPITNLLRSTWKPFESEFGKCLTNMEKHTITVEREAFACSVRADDVRFKELQRLLNRPEVEKTVALPCYCVSYPVNHRFWGRSQILKDIKSQLLPPENSKREIQQSFAIWGMGGVGKTQIALQFVHQNRDRFDAILWARSDTLLKLRESFVAIGTALGLVESGEDAEHCREETLKWLQKTDSKWLLIFDNADEPSLLAKYWPASATGAILLTSRNPAIARGKTKSGLEVTLPGVEEAAELFLNTISDSNEGNPVNDNDLANNTRVISQRIAQALGCLPLAICQMAGFVQETKCDLDEFLPLIQDDQGSKTLLSEGTGEVSGFYDYTITNAWDLSMSALDRNSTDLLSLMTFLDPDSIPEFLFRSNKQEGILLQVSQNRISEMKAIGSLTRHSLIHRNTANPQTSISSVSLHRLVQRASFERMSVDQRQHYFRAAIDIVWREFPRQELGCPMEKHWPQCRVLLTHVSELVRHYKTHAKGETKIENLAEIIANCGWFMYEQGLYLEAIPMLESGLEILGTSHLENTVIAADIHSAWGAIVKEQVKYGESYDHHSAALRILKAILPSNHVHLANAYMNLANTLNGLKRFDESSVYHKKAIAIREENPHVARPMLGLSYGNYGRLLMRIGAVEQAAKMLEKSVEIRTETMGEKSAKTANALHALGNVYIAQGKCDDAFILHTKTLDIRLAVRSDLHQTAASCHKVAWHFHQRKDYERAVELLQKALTMYGKYGASDGGLARSGYKLAAVYQDMGRTEEAQKYKAEAAALRQKLLHIEPGEQDNEEGYDELVMLVDH